MVPQLALFHLGTLGCRLTQPKRNIQYKRSADGVQLLFVVSLGCFLCICLPTRASVWHNRKQTFTIALHHPRSKICDMCAVMIHSFLFTSFPSLVRTVMSKLNALLWVLPYRWWYHCMVLICLLYINTHNSYFTKLMFITLKTHFLTKDLLG